MHGFIVVFNNFLNKLMVIFFGICFQIFWNFTFNYLHAHLSFEAIGFHSKQVNHSLKFIF